MKRGIILLIIILSAGLLLGFDDRVPMLEFPEDVNYRVYKIGNVVTGRDPVDLDAILEAFEMIEDLSQGGEEDIPVVTVPTHVNWDGYVHQEEVDFISTMRFYMNYNVDVHFVVDPLPHRIYLGGQDPPPPGTCFADPAVRQVFQDYSLDVIDRIAPEYITLGTEINMYYHGLGIQDYVHLNSLINETADLVRAASPETKIITSFQWEHLLCFISSIGWEPIENFEWNIDILGISTFPMTFLKYLDPSWLPSWYFNQIYLHFPPNHTPATLALTFTEVGFPSMPEYGTYGSEKQQSNGIVTLIEHAAKFVHLEFIDYWYLHDHDGYFRQHSYGLIESTTTSGGIPGRKKPSYFMWEQLGQLPYIPNPIQSDGS